jgi:O-succinylbenzoic acid--CoA ligase
MPELVAIAQSGQTFVDSMRRIWDRGDSVLPIDVRLPRPAVAALLDAMRPHRIIDTDGGSSALRDPLPTEPGDALVVPTSGSTGVPKGVVHTHTSIEASARSTSDALGVDPASDRWLCCLPLAHIAGLAVVSRALTFGVPLEVHDRFDADAVMDAARNGATLTALVPTALDRIDPSLFRRMIIGGSAAPEHLPANCVMSYGMTETGSAVVFDGRALPGVELRIVDDEIQVRGPMLLRRYRDGTDPRTADGWLPTNDAGTLDADGVLTVQGRRGDLIITGGENVWPAPIESVLSALASVAEVAIIGRPDEQWGELVTAVVVPSDPGRPPSLDELRDRVRESLPAFCAPRGLELRTALPRTALGKVERRSL